MNKICTSKEQSQELIELGIDISTADMFWHRTLGGIYTLRVNDIMTKLDIPAWSLSVLLDLMPIINDGTYTMRGTLDKGAVISHEEATCVMCQEKTPIDAAFEMVCWLLKNNKI